MAAAGKVNVNRASLAGLAGDLDLAAVGRDDLADDRQAQPGAARNAWSIGTR